MAKRSFEQGELSDEQIKMRRDAREVVEARLRGSDAKFEGFVNVNLTGDEKAEFAGWVETADFAGLLSFVVEEGNVLSVKAGKEGKGFSAAVTCRWAKSTNAGWCVNMRADDPLKACWRVLFVVCVLLKGDWREANARRGESDW